MQDATALRFCRLFVLFVIGSVIGGCSSSGNIRSDYDSTANFGEYRTYNFIEGAGPDGGYQDLFTQYMIAAIDIEMKKRGYVKSNDPDLYVNFNANLQDKTKVTTTPAPATPYYGYRGGFYDPWMGYGYGTQTHVSQYTEGTFNIDLVDVRQKRLVWEAVGIGRVTEKDLSELEERVREGVPKYFEQYPFMAGSAEPTAAEK